MSFVVAPFSSLAQSVPYQGRLTGLPPDSATGLKTIEVSIFDSATNGANLWGPKTFPSTPVVDGFFNVVLPDLDDHTNSLAALGSGSAYIEVVVGAITNTPRQQILAVPVALNGTPPGVIDAFAGQTNAVPAGWLLCDGREVSRTRYAALLASIKDAAWGAGDGSTTFNLPDLRGQFLRGAGQNGDSAYRYSNDVSRVTGSTQRDQLQTHDHRLGNNIKLDQTGAPDQPRCVQAPTSNPGTTGVGTWGFTDEAVRRGDETRPKNAAVNFIIKY